MMTRRGTIAGLSGNPMSGLWMLAMNTDFGGETVFIESGYGVRNLAACFGATEGTGDLMEKIVGQDLVYSVDEMGVLYAFTPADEWTGPEVPPEGLDDDAFNDIGEEH